MFALTIHRAHTEVQRRDTRVLHASDLSAAPGGTSCELSDTPAHGLFRILCSLGDTE